MEVGLLFIIYSIFFLHPISISCTVRLIIPARNTNYRRFFRRHCSLSLTGL